VAVSIRRATQADVDFLVGLVTDADVEPFLGAVSAREPATMRREVERSEREPHDFGRFVIEVDGERAGAMGFELVNRRSRVAHLERLAVHPSFRGRRLADEAARLLQHHLVVDLGFHRLELEIYGFNERAQRHAERAGFAREGVRRRSYWRHGGWTDGVLYGLVADDLDVPDEIRLLHDYVMAHNESVRTGSWDGFGEWFTEGAELRFDGVPIGPFHGRKEIERAYAERPPDDEVLVFRAAVEQGRAVADYGWRAEPASVAGRILLRPSGRQIAELVVTFERRASGS
jgi:RimJ/RimL family protein N-acetyltransferase